MILLSFNTSINKINKINKIFDQPFRKIEKDSLLLFLAFCRISIVYIQNQRFYIQLQFKIEIQLQSNLT